MTNETAWLIETGGPCYMSVGATGGADSVSRFFRWTDDANKALRFSRKEDAEAAMFAIRGLQDKLFPTVFPHFPKPVEHMWCGNPALGEPSSEKETN